MIKVISKLKLYGTSACDATIILGPLARQWPGLSDACESGKIVTLFNVFFIMLKTCFCLTTVSNIMILF